MAERLLARLNERLGLDLPQGEAIALAMHLFHAVTGSASMAETFVQSALIGQIFDTLARAYGDRFDPASIDAARFAAHLRFFFARARTGTQLDDQVGAVGSVLQARSPGAYQLAQRLRALLEMRLDHSVSDDEVVYLALHLTRLESGMSRARA